MKISVSGLAVHVPSAELLSSVELQVEAGGWTTIIGPNGAGKSTLIRCIAGLARYSGEVRIDGAEISRMKPRDRARRIAYLPQRFSDPGPLTANDFVMLGRAPHRPAMGGATARDSEVVSDAMNTLDLAGLEDRFLDSLSGGELQRVRLAQAIVQETPVLLLDEPTTALDIGRAQHLLDLLSRLRSEKGLTVVLTMHDLSLAGHYGDKVVLMARGRVVAAGPSPEVLTASNLARYYDARVDIVSKGDRVSVIPT